MYKINVLFSKDWNDLVCFVIQRRNSSEIIISIPTRYKKEFKIALEIRPSSTLASFEAEKFFSVYSDIKFGIHQITLKSGVVLLDSKKASDSSGFLEININSDDSAQYQFTEHFIEDVLILGETLKSLRKNYVYPPRC